MAHFKALVEGNTVNNAALLEGPVCKQGKHTTGGTFTDDIFLMVLKCINVRNCIRIGIILLKRTDSGAKSAVDAQFLVDFRVSKSAVICFHLNCRFGTGEAASHTAAAVLFFLIGCKHNIKIL